MRTSGVTNRQKPESVRTIDDAAAHSRAYLEDGIWSLSQAFNLLDRAELRYTWDAATTHRVLRLLAELQGLATVGTLRTREGAVAQDDASFQKFIAHSIGGSHNAPNAER